MPRGVPNTTKIPDPDNVAVAAFVDHMIERSAEPPIRLIPVKLLRNYRPWVCVDEKIGKETKVTPFPAEHIVGYHRPAKMRKDAAGKPVEVEPAMFIKGELPPPSKFGVGFEGKIWAGAVIRVTKDEAAYVRKNGIGEIEIDDE